MRSKTILEKLPQLIDYALAVAINSIPGISETDSRVSSSVFQTI